MADKPEASDKQPYIPPVLKEYGNLHLITRGSTAMGNDGSGGMTGVTMTMMGGGMMGGGMMGGGMGMQKFFGF